MPGGFVGEAWKVRNSGESKNFAQMISSPGAAVSLKKERYEAKGLLTAGTFETLCFDVYAAPISRIQYTHLQAILYI